MIILMDENENFQHLEEMIANLQVKQKQILKGMLDYPIQIDSAMGILSDPSRQLAITHNNITRIQSISIRLDKRLSAQPSYSCYPWPPVYFFVPYYVGKSILG